MNIETYRKLATEMGIVDAEYCIGRYVGTGGMVRWSTQMHGLSLERARQYVHDFYPHMIIRTNEEVLAEIERNAEREAQDARIRRALYEYDHTHE